MSDSPVTVVPQAKKRYEWIDNARIVAAFLIMMRHLPCIEAPGDFPLVSFVKTLLQDLVYNGRVPFFLILAGYFLSRNVTWKKAWDRFIWLLIPFVIWNAIYAYGACHHAITVQSVCVDLLGINNIGDEWAFSIFGPDVTGRPCITPSWFLRDVMILSLLTPLIVRISKWIPCVLVIMTSIMFCNTMRPNPMALFSPGTIYFYLLGVFLVRFRLDDAYRILNRGFLPYFVAGLLAPCMFVAGMYIFGVHGIQITIANSARYVLLSKLFAGFVGMTFGALIIAYCGILIEKLTPRLSKILAPLGPACFLVFMLHSPIFHLLRRLFPSMFEGWTALLIPIPVFIFICAFFLAMKHYTPCLMPYLGHMKVPKKPH